jgi:excisionase family DNA binding protein
MTISTKYLSAREVAKELGVSVRRVYQYVDTGYLKATRFGNLVLVISRPDLSVFLKGLSERRATFKANHPEMVWATFSNLLPCSFSRSLTRFSSAEQFQNPTNKQSRWRGAGEQRNRMIPDKTYKNDYSATELEALEKETEKREAAYEEKKAERDYATEVMQRQKEAQTKFLEYAVRGYRLEDSSESTHVSSGW